MTQNYESGHGLDSPAHYTTHPEGMYKDLQNLLP